jgi:hypothetical protein
VARKSLIQRAEVDEVINAHNCQQNPKHRLKRGDRRLKVWKARSADHYCLGCALSIIEHDIAKLRKLDQQLREENAVSLPHSG